MTLSVNTSGTWVDGSPHVNDGGDDLPGSAAYARVNGFWAQFYGERDPFLYNVLERFATADSTVLDFGL